MTSLAGALVDEAEALAALAVDALAEAIEAALGDGDPPPPTRARAPAPAIDSAESPSI